MQVKKYVGENIQDVIWKVKADLGPEAVIIHTHRFREGGILGMWGGKEKVEVVAAIAPQENPVKEQRETTNDVSSETQFNVLQKQILELKSFMQSMMNKSSLESGYSPEINKIYNFLLDNDMEKTLAENIVNKFQEDVPPTSYGQENIVREYLTNFFKGVIQIGEPIKVNKGKGKLVAVVGPTGVGKTTTLAKLTAYFSLMENQDVVLLTADTYRIAAVEQLRTYGEIMDIPVEAVYTTEELIQALDKYKDKDLIFLDTAGRSQKNAQQMLELKELLQDANPEEIYLVLSATTKYKDLQDIVDHFSKVNFNKIILTKLDETVSYGAVLSLLNYIDKPVSYLTIGQNVPDDIKHVSSTDLINPLVEGLGQ